MPLLDDTVLDAALLKVKDDTTTLHICSASPTTYTEAATTFSIGNKATPVIGMPADRTGGGREIIAAAFTDGTTTTSATATHWALVSGSVLLASGTITPNKAVASGSPFELAAFTVGALDPT